MTDDWASRFVEEPTMQKRDELADPASCLNRAKDDELLFVLLARDLDAPDTIRDWVRRRILRGKNSADDPQITEALALAQAMEENQEENR